LEQSIESTLYLSIPFRPPNLCPNSPTRFSAKAESATISVRHSGSMFQVVCVVIAAASLVISVALRKWQVVVIVVVVVGHVLAENQN